MSDPEIDGSWENAVKCQDGQFATRASPGEGGIFKKLPLSWNWDHFYSFQFWGHSHPDWKLKNDFKKANAN